MEDAQKFPFISSAALFGLFCAFKFLDPDWVNWVISFYFTAAGAMAVMGTLIPIIEQGEIVREAKDEGLRKE